MNIFDRAGIEAELRRRLYPEDELHARIEQLEAAGRALLESVDNVHLDGSCADTQAVRDAEAEFRAVLDSDVITD